jgi:type 1 fimbriae regulatory protein FimB/type 1 fimbriae regulatory protein FimE
MSKSVARKAARERVPTTESGTVLPIPDSQGDDAAFIAGVRSCGTAAYRDVVARLRVTRLQSTDGDDGETADTAQARKRRAPRKPVETDDRRQYLTEREVEHLCDAARKRGRHGHRDGTMILIAYRHGLRVSELVALQWGQVDLEAGRLQVIRRKGSDDSVQPLSGVEIRALRKIRREQPAGLRHLFVSERGAPFTANGFFKTLSRAAASIGLADVHPHLLRHACGFKLVNDGSIPAPWRHISGTGRSPTRPGIRRWMRHALTGSGRTDVRPAGIAARERWAPRAEEPSGRPKLPAEHAAGRRGAGDWNGHRERMQVVGTAKATPGTDRRRIEGGRS